ncbi:MULTISPECIES: ABC transporter permease [Acidobacterium]|uniref:ABC transporter, probable glycolipid exporter (DevE) family, permease protein n=1 Tax=Acidobacterium capsulatum (strain ATCC 51196 / DSM 11244 / BCRC 80197 / JCM 7670 / NBRC 15755 / NCIMB 13165 / 161) TaxID=240015 RepID=C1F1Y7_ACIC5|nr:ABC transporter, probable glycolipid exporter (DevE) family, permease protein [Acidobacterium capsulatum ATCC 51196]HCT61266.1 ABC transporter permease [Acidobacterium sp.]
MRGILKLAFKLLVNDRSKFTALLTGITFAAFLMVVMTSLFAGVLNRASSTVINIGADMWVMDPSVQTVASSIGLPDYLLDSVRSIPGVKYAVPLFSGTALVKLGNGTYQAVSVLGLDDTSLFGRPTMLQGNIQNIFAESSFILVRDSEFSKFGDAHLGTEFELNDHRGVLVGIAKAPTSSLFGLPTLYTTYNRAIQYIPNPRFTISYVLVEPKSAADVPEIQRRVAALGYLALTRAQFENRISDFYKYQTGLGINILIMTTISFIVGLSISGQTFYTFILENLEKFGALKAIGTKSRELIAMILFQSTVTALIGYGLGVGLCTTLTTLAKMRLPDYASRITFFNLALALGMVVLISAISSYVGVRKVLRIEPFDVFRG